MCFLAIPFSVSHAILLQSVSSLLFIEALRWNLAVVAIQIILFVWFVALYSRVRINWFLYAVSLMFVLMFIVNLLQPYTLQYSAFIGFQSLPLPWGELKIDKAFIDEMLLNQDHTLVESIMAIDGCMKLKVIAEGVESAMQRDALLNLGCTQFQGYLFSKPLPEIEFLKWVTLQQSELNDK
jgi:hypothetical protein